MSVTSDILRASARLAILRSLAASGDYKLNTSVLQDALDDIGLSMTRGQVETECAWLAERDCVATSRHESAVVVVLTERGGNVASGREIVEGIKRPRPGG